MSCGVGLRRGSDLVVLWLWYRTASTALMQPLQPLTWGSAYTMGRPYKDKKKDDLRKINILISLFQKFYFISNS